MIGTHGLFFLLVWLRAHLLALRKDNQNKTDSAGRRQTTISDSIRETLYRYILEDFRGRLNIAVIWLNEEYYNDRIKMKSAANQRAGSEEEAQPTVALHYDTWVVRLLDGFLAYLDSRDIKVLVRFLSEVPEITIPITQRVASLAKDPERVKSLRSSFDVSFALCCHHDYLTDSPLGTWSCSDPQHERCA